MCVGELSCAEVGPGENSGQGAPIPPGLSKWAHGNLIPAVAHLISQNPGADPAMGGS